MGQQLVIDRCWMTEGYAVFTEKGLPQEHHPTNAESGAKSSYLEIRLENTMQVLRPVPSHFIWYSAGVVRSCGSKIQKWRTNASRMHRCSIPGTR